MAIKKVDLSKLTTIQRKQLLKELSAEQSKERKLREKEFASYKEQVAATVDNIFPNLVEVSKAIAKVKQLVYDKTKALVQKKANLYEDSVNNQSHTFTNENGSISITIGYRVIDGWDDTVNAGINKVKKYISTINGGGNEEMKFLREAFDKLLSKDAQGNLKASRVLELKKAAEKVTNQDLHTGISIIEKAYKPKRTKNFVSVVFTDKEGKQQSLPLSITDADIKI